PLALDLGDAGEPLEVGCLRAAGGVVGAGVGGLARRRPRRLVELALGQLAGLLAGLTLADGGLGGLHGLGLIGKKLVALGRRSLVGAGALGLLALALAHHLLEHGGHEGGELERLVLAAARRAADLGALALGLSATVGAGRGLGVPLGGEATRIAD